MWGGAGDPTAVANCYLEKTGGLGMKNQILRGESQRGEAIKGGRSASVSDETASSGSSGGQRDSGAWLTHIRGAANSSISLMPLCIYEHVGLCNIANLLLFGFSFFSDFVT